MLNLHSIFSRYAPIDTLGEPLRRLSTNYIQTQLLVRVFYFGVLYLTALKMSSWNRDWQHNRFDLLWPVSWIELIGIPLGINIIHAIAIIGAILAAMAPRVRLFRVLVFIGFLSLAAFYNSFGKIGHNLHFWIYVSFFFVFLPGQETRHESTHAMRYRYVSTFKAAQASILLAYSVSGLWKLVAGVQQFIAGEVSIFHPMGLSHHVAATIVQSGSNPVLAAVILDWWWLGALLMPAAALVEWLSIFILPFPRLLRIWGYLLMSIHLSSGLTMGVYFSTQYLLLGILICLSPTGQGLGDITLLAKKQAADQLHNCR